MRAPLGLNSDGLAPGCARYAPAPQLSVRLHTYKRSRCELHRPPTGQRVMTFVCQHTDKRSVRQQDDCRFYEGDGYVQGPTRQQGSKEAEEGSVRHQATITNGTNTAGAKRGGGSVQEEVRFGASEIYWQAHARAASTPRFLNDRQQGTCHAPVFSGTCAAIAPRPSALPDSAPCAAALLDGINPGLSTIGRAAAYWMTRVAAAMVEREIMRSPISICTSSALTVANRHRRFLPRSPLELHRRLDLERAAVCAAVHRAGRAQRDCNRDWRGVMTLH
jgi:hypothetical protein